MVKEIMIKVNVFVVFGFDGLVKNLVEGQKIVEEIGFLVMIKVIVGGGGKGMCIVFVVDQFEKNWNLVCQEVKVVFGNDGIYIEKFVEEFCYIEFQIVGDQFGKVIYLLECDCFIQCCYQKLVEECFFLFMIDELCEKMGEVVVCAGEYINYEGVGMVEFLVDKYCNFYFMEMNICIQVEYLVMEEVIDYDLIKEQIKIVVGEFIIGENYFLIGYVIECWINVEDLFNDFCLSFGRIQLFYSLKGYGV